MTHNKSRRAICCVFMVDSVMPYFQTCQWAVSSAWSLGGHHRSAAERLFVLLTVQGGLRLYYHDLRFSNRNCDCYSSDDLQRDRHVAYLIIRGADRRSWDDSHVLKPSLQYRTGLLLSLRPFARLCWGSWWEVFLSNFPRSGAVPWLLTK